MSGFSAEASSTEASRTEASSIETSRTESTQAFSTETVRFEADGIPLVGHLRRPAGITGLSPAVILTGPFTGVKEQVTGLYGERLSAAGYVTLAIDHRGFGGSGGRRGHEDSQGKLADLRAGVTFLSGLLDVDELRIAAVGICLGGGYAVRAAASDPRIRAVAGIAGAYNSPVRFAGADVDGYRSALAGFLARYDEFLPAVAVEGEAAMGGVEPWAYYGTSRSARGGTGGDWVNQVTRGSLHSLMTFDALSAADLLGATPLLVVHGRVDDYCSPELAAELHERAPGPKQLVWLDAAQHIDFYDVEPWVGHAVDATVAHLRRFV
jgi:fermentation-respiration switch protein FrsA (DUF1100 family)